MKTAVIAGLALVLAALCSPVAKAWSCPSGQIRQQAPAGTPTTAPYYDVVEGIAFICVPADPTPTPSTSTNSSNSNSNSSANANSNSQSSSNSTSGASSTSRATGGNASATGGNASATGGNATGGNATGGSVKDSGNSQNTNVNTALGGAGGSANQKQGQSQSQSLSNSGNSSASANGNGSNSGNNSNNNITNVPRQTATAVAPMVMPTVPCFKGFGAGAQGPAFGASFGGGKIDPNCAALETARSFLAAGARVAYCKTMLSTKSAKAAGVTMDDCMGSGVVQVEQGPAQVVDTTPITINIPAPVILQAPPSVVTVIPAPAAPPAPSVAQAAAVHKAERQHAVKHAPCVTN